MKLLAVFVLPAAIVLGLAYSETHLLGGSSGSSQAQARGLVWAGHTFADRGDFSRWLRSRGIRYQVWARRHPALAGLAPRHRVRPVRRAAEVRKADHRSTGVPAGLAGAAGVLALLCLALLLRRRRVRRWGSARRQWMQRLPLHGLVLSGRAVGVLADLGWAATVHIHDRLARATKKLPAGDPGLTARRAAVAAAGGVRLMLRWATVAALLCSTPPRAALSVAQRRRGELAWCLATAVLAAGTGLLVAAWLNGA